MGAMNRQMIRTIGVLLGCVSFSCVHADTLRVAVAANFLKPLKTLSEEFEQRTSHRIEPIAGATGALYAQIVNGAPYDVFLAADQARPQRLEEAGLASDRTTYAVGRLVLWSTTRELSELADVNSAEVRRIGMANPRLAPFGAAAREVAAHLEIDANKLVFGQNVLQTVAHAATGSVDVAFVSLSAIGAGGSHVVVPQELYQPVLQDAVVLARTERPAVARLWLDFLTSEEAQCSIELSGYARADGLPRSR